MNKQRRKEDTRPAKNKKTKRQGKLMTISRDKEIKRKSHRDMSK